MRSPFTWSNFCIIYCFVENFSSALACFASQNSRSTHNSANRLFFSLTPLHQSIIDRFNASTSQRQRKLGINLRHFSWDRDKKGFDKACRSIKLSKDYLEYGNGRKEAWKKIKLHFLGENSIGGLRSRQTLSFNWIKNTIFFFGSYFSRV